MRFRFLILLVCSAFLSHSQTSFEVVYGVDTLSEKAVCVSQVSSTTILVGGYEKAVSSDGDISLLKFDTSGNVVWKNLYGTSNDDVANGGCYAMDSSFAVICGLTIDKFDDYNGLIVKVDTSGVLSNVINYGQLMVSESFKSVTVSQDGEIVACGMIADTIGLGNDILVVKFDVAGGVVFEKVFGGAYNDYAQSIKETSDSGYVVLCDSKSVTQNGNYSMILMKLDADGNLEWETTIGDKFQVNGAQCVIERSDGKYMLVGESIIDGTFKFEFTIAVVDQYGNLEWLRFLPGVGSDAAFSIVEINSDTYAITGYTSTNSVGSTLDVPLLLVDANGLQKSVNLFGAYSADVGFEIVNSLSGGALIAGATGDSISTDYYLVHQKELMLPVVETANKSNTEHYSIYPNPSRGAFMIEFSGDHSGAIVEIFNSIGAKVWSAEVDNSKYFVSHSLPSGIYFVEASIDEISLGRNKLVVQN